MSLPSPRHSSLVPSLGQGWIVWTWREAHSLGLGGTGNQVQEWELGASGKQGWVPA